MALKFDNQEKADEIFRLFDNLSEADKYRVAGQINLRTKDGGGKGTMEVKL